MSFIGSLKHKVTFLKQVTTKDDIGGKVDSWDEFATIDANVSMASDSSRYYSEKLGVVYSHKVIMRERKDVNINMRLRFNNEVYQILSIVSDTKRLRFQVLKIQKVK